MPTLVGVLILSGGVAVSYLHADPAPLQQSSTPQSKDKKKKQGVDQSKQPDQQDQQATPAPADQQAQPAPLFQGKSNLKSSRQTKDTATAGFNGIGPNGEVDKKLLAAAADGDDQNKAEMIANMHFKRSEVDAFVTQGNLKSGGK